MSPTVDPAPAAAPALAPALADVLSRIPPLWPLDRFVAVNPFVGLADLTFTAAAARLLQVTGTAPVQAPADYLAAFRRGEITRADLAAVAGADWDPESLVAALEHPDATRAVAPLATVADLLDAERPQAHWSAFVVDEVSKWCAVHFDQNQAVWRSPWRDLDLYAAWREAAAHDGNPEAFGLAGFRGFVRALPATAPDAVARCLEVLAPVPVDLGDFLWRQLATISGWAGYARHLDHEETLRGRQGRHLGDLLAIRLAYDAALFRAFQADAQFRASWRSLRAPAVDARGLDALVRWQRAYERNYQRRLAFSLAWARPPGPSARPDFDAVFCIDVRSEVIRRHLEKAAPGGRTHGLAGFFGFPVGHVPEAGGEPSARFPVLLAPAFPSETPDAAPARTRRRPAAARAWQALQNSAASCFAFVELAGLAFGATLRRPERSDRACRRVAPRLAADLDQLVRLAAGILQPLLSSGPLARLVLICGHGSRSANNPHAASLACGACGGHAGDVNARLAVATLNRPDVRARLAQVGLVVPADTVFVAGLHETSTDDVTWFDPEGVPASHASEFARLQSAVQHAAAATRRERAPALGVAAADDDALAAALRARAEDIAEVRPEWGLANNAAFIAAPRHRSAAFDLRGRAFLHDYDPAADPDGTGLAQLLAGPVVVASWINLQYYASRLDPDLRGAGNKALHHVCGGVGACEGNGGDLKTGLPLQSLHDGDRFVHEPRRLTVYIDAARPQLDRALAGQAHVRELFDHGWIHLVAFEGAEAFARESGRWIRLEP